MAVARNGDWDAGAVLTNLFSCIAFFVAWWPIYAVLNRYNSLPDRALFLETRPIDLFPSIFMPCFVVFYVGALILLLGEACYLLNTRAFRCLLLSFIVASAIGFAVCVAFPLNMRRPTFNADSWCHRLMTLVIGVDAPANCLPSFHVAFSCIAAGSISFHAFSFKHVFAAWVLAGLVWWSAIAVGQHYFVDIAAGLVLATLSIWVGRRISGIESEPVPVISRRHWP